MKATPSDQQLSNQPSDGGHDRNRLILIVEDDAGMSAMLAIALEDAQYDVQIAPNGAEALELLAELRPAVILLDVRMPVMDGPAFLQALAERHDYQPPPIIVMTAYRDISPEIIGLGHPTINKPMKIDALLEMVGRYAG